MAVVNSMRYAVMKKLTFAFYNILALAFAGLNLLNSILAWHMFGVTQDADIWLLSIATTGAFNVLALLGVEQFLYCYADERSKSPDHANDFAKTVLLWSLISGVIFALLCGLLMPYIAHLFAGGMGGGAQERLAVLLLAMLPQTAAAPCLHVARQLLNAHGSYARSYLLVLWAPLVLLFAQIVGMWRGAGLEELAVLVGVGAIFQVLLCLYLVGGWWRAGRLLRSPFMALRGFVWKSVLMRGAHALHNFLSVAIIGNVLSTLSAGNLSTFLYAKRIADGVSSISMGPHNNIYHAKLSQAWAEFDRIASLGAAHAYLKHVVSIFSLGVASVWFLLPTALSVTSSFVDKASIDLLITIFLVISLWNMIVILESVFVAMLTTAHRAMVFGLVNGLFIIVFYVLTRVELGFPPFLKLPIAASIAQTISLALFAVNAVYLFRHHFTKGPSYTC